ncbi:hypothetical protein H6F61_24435 [Cyanobacteria bacterium FACHB-472]|nr:hypothetical protein [Cyanobacteria bacterium FACHB-472]
MGDAPTLPDNAPTAVVLFAGGDGVEAGMVMAGVRPALRGNATLVELKSLPHLLA